MNFQNKLEHLIAAGFQLLYVPTAERDRCEGELTQLATKLNLEFITWDGINGLSNDANSKDPISALQSIEASRSVKDSLIVMRNLHVFLEDPIVRQMVQNLYYGCKLSNETVKRPIVILAPIQQIHEEISSCITVVEYTLPDQEKLTDVFNTVADSVSFVSKEGTTAECTDELKDKAVQALKGLTTIEAENILAYSLRVNRGYASNFIDTIEDQKAKTIQKSEVLTYVPKDAIASMDDIGGYENLKEFVKVRNKAYTKQARELNIDLPRGVVLLGIPGTAKSLAAKVIAREFGLPLIVLNIGAVYGSLVGESERRIRSALNTIDALDGSVVLVDEAEKALGGADQAAGDSGVSRRVFGTLLTWLTEKKSRTFVVMTMNRTRGIPPEFLRRGRFDQIFYTDLPDAVERDVILRIHCKKRGVDTKVLNADWDKLIDATNNFVGAELEQLVCDARFEAFSSRSTGQPNMSELVKAATEIKPLYYAETETIEDIRRLAEGYACPVAIKRHAPAKKSRAVKV